MAASTLSKSLRLWQYSDHFLLEPLDSVGPDCLVIKRPDGALSLTGRPPVTPPISPPTTVYGFLGLIDLLSGPYLVVISQRELVGSFRRSYVYRVRGARVLPCNPSLARLTPRQRSDEKKYVKLVLSALSAPGLFVSYQADLTVSTQKREKAGPGFTSLPLWQQADERFFWNRHLLSSAIDRRDKGLDAFLLPVMQGSFQTFQVIAKLKVANVMLIARRGVKRIGTRMWRRGADTQGQVANFVETEQIVEVDGTTAAFLQVRGSIPLLWEQVVDLTYKPRLKPVTSGPQASRVTAQHLRQLTDTYGSVLVLDLINQKGGEGQLGKLYASAMQELPGLPVRYVAFDFHKECGHLHFENLAALHKQIRETLQEQGYFVMTADRRVVREQKGVARTNCIDCLDRTNVTQSLLARRALEEQLQALGVFEAHDTIKHHPDFDRLYNILWANHGDDISTQYSGTGALKGDFVRYGRRSTVGPLTDGRNSLMRYYYNNFTDGARQDALDLVTGGYVVNPNAPSPFAKQGIEKYTNLVVALSLMLAGAALAYNAILQVGERPVASVLTAVAGAGVAAAIGLSLKLFGREYTDRPRLCKLR